MRAVVIHETGGVDVLREEEVDRPEPGDGEVLLRVHAASVNPVDWKNRQGLSPTDLPAILGRDLCGVVEASRADGFAEGDVAFGSSKSGAYAEYSTAAGTQIAKKPDGVSHEQAASIPVAGMTAWQALFDRAGLESGQRVLVTGAAGGVGHFAVQFAKHAGGHVIGTGSGRNREFVLGLGADEYVDYTEQDAGSAVSDADVVLDTVGADSASLVPALREGGVIVTIASAPPEDAARERGARAELLVMSPKAEHLERIAELVASGEIHVEIQETLPLSEVSRAHELSESGHVRGKLVLSIST